MIVSILCVVISLYICKVYKGESLFLILMTMIGMWGFILIPSKHFNDEVKSLQKERETYIATYIDIVSNKDLTEEETTEELQPLLQEIDNYNERLNEMERLSWLFCSDADVYKEVLSLQDDISKTVIEGKHV